MIGRCIAAMAAATLLPGAALVALAGTARAASFDCGRATTTVERTICGDKDLSALDERLDAAFRAASGDLSTAPQVRADQRAWLAQRNRCTTAACLGDAYRVRLAQLEKGSAAAAPPAPMSCAAERGAAAAAVLVQQCVRVSPATRPPCNAANPCALIADEVARGCGMYPAPTPDFCRPYLPGR